MSDGLKKGLKITACVAVILVLLYQIYKFFYNPFTTETVTAVTYFDGIDSVGMVIREEQIITADTKGVISYPLKEGSRVASGGTVANVFGSAEAADAYLKVQKIEAEINMLKETQTYNDLYAADVSLLDSKIYSSLCSLLDDRQGRQKGLGDIYGNDLCNYLDRKQIVTGAVNDFGTRIASLEAEKASLEGIYSGNVGSVPSPVSGYFISVVDGYESVVDTDELESLDPVKFASLTPSEVPANAICKVVTDYKWYIAVSIPYDYSMTLSIGQSMTLRTAIEGYTELPVSVRCINRTDGSDKAVAVFTCKIMNEELAGLRTIPVTVVKEKFSGLKVSNEAIRAVDKKLGVYTVAGGMMSFVPVKVLYTGKYSIVEKEITEETALRLYDVIIVKGRNLSEGKSVD